VADGAADASAIAQALGIPKLAAWGISGGGPTALACAALLPDLVFAVCLFAPLGPYGAVPSAHGRRLAAQIPGIDAHFPADDDHATIEAAHRGQAYDWLLARA
jgi:pimeloyl-ACP methyl ester carboxylesterase